MKFTKTTSAFALIAALAAGALSYAAAPAAPELPLSRIISSLESMGYTAFEEVEKERSAWEIEATAANGTRVELKVDPVDGRVLSEKPERRQPASAGQ